MRKIHSFLKIENKRRLCKMHLSQMLKDIFGRHIFFIYVTLKVDLLRRPVAYKTKRLSPKRFLFFETSLLARTCFSILFFRLSAINPPTPNLICANSHQRLRCLLYFSVMFHWVLFDVYLLIVSVPPETWLRKLICWSLPGKKTLYLVCP